MGGRTTQRPRCARGLAQPSTGRPACRRRGIATPAGSGLECPSVRAAVWMMRALVASNVLSRREGTVLFVPINPVRDPDGERVAACVASIHGLAAERRLL